AISPQAATVGYSRAVRDGRHVHVAGTAPIGTDTTDPYEQAKRGIDIRIHARRPGDARTRDRGPGARRGRRAARARRPHRRLPRRRRRLGSGRAGARRGVRGRPPRVGDARDPRAARPAVEGGDRGGGAASGMTKQAYPPSITGKGGRYAVGGSVLDHAYGQRDPYTLGVEEEYMLLDGETFDLVQHIDTVLADVSGHELEPVINAELMQSVLEIATPVCHTTGEVGEQLRKIRSYVGGIARDEGLRVGSAGTHPFSLFERQRITARDRYRALVDQMQYVARRELIFGMHIHVAVDDPDKAIQVVNGLLPHIGPLLALSASSPFWR